MPQTLAIHCDVHQLVDQQYSAGWTDFSVSLATSLEGWDSSAVNTELAQALLLPWNWQSLSFAFGQAARAVDAALSTLAPEVTSYGATPLDHQPINWKSFLQQLESSLLGRSDLAAYLQYQKAGDPNSSLASQLATLQGLGTSTPQWLNLVRFIRAKSADLPKGQIIAPIPKFGLSLPNGGPALTLTPRVDQAKVGSTDGGYQISCCYDIAPADAVPFQVRAEIHLDPQWAPDQDALIDPSKLVVRGGSTGNFRRCGTDWLAGLAARLADGVDLPGHLLAWAEWRLCSRPAGESGALPGYRAIAGSNRVAAELPVLRKLFLAACLTVVHAGARAEAGEAHPADPDDPASLADDLLAAAQHQLAGTSPLSAKDAENRHGWVRALRKGDEGRTQPHQNDLDSWRGELRALLAQAGVVPGAPANVAKEVDPKVPPFLWVGSLAADADGSRALTQDEVDRELLGMRSVNNALWEGETVTSLMLQLWKDLPGSSLPDDLLAKVKEIGDQRRRGLRRQLTLGSFGPARWQALFPSAGQQGDSDAAAVCTAFPEQFHDFAAKSFGLAGGLPDELARFLKTRAASFANIGKDDEAAPAQPAVPNSLLGFNPDSRYEDEYGDPTPAPHPGGLVFAFDRVQQHSDDDHLNRIAGVVVFLKQGAGEAAGKSLGELSTTENLLRYFGPWRSLNIANLSIKTVDCGAGACDFSEPGVLPPVRIGTGGGIKHALISYDAHPLIARSPAADLLGDLARQQPALPALLDSRYDTPDPQGWALLPELRFGQVYALQAFAKTHAGALPSQLVAPDGHPAYLKPWTPQVDIGTQPADGSPPLARVARYLRRVPIGAPAWQDIPRDERPAGDPIPAPRLPKFPAALAPLAPELPPWGNGGSGATFDLPLVLLQPKWGNSQLAETTQFEFDLRLPGVDLLTWDRWVASDGARSADPSVIKERRKEVWTAYYTELGSREATRSAESLAIDDPAVTGLAVKVSERNPWAAEPARSKTLLIKTLPPYPGSSGLPALRRPPLRVRVRYDSADGWDLAYLEESRLLEIRVPEGQVVEVEIATLATAAEFFQKPPALPAARLLAWGDFGYSPLEEEHTLVRCATLRFVVEVATALLPAPGALRDALIPAVYGEKLQVRLATDRSAPFAYLHWAELRRQVWRWDGRDLPDFPWPPPDGKVAFDPLLSDQDACAEWEVRAFGANWDDDYFEQRSRVVFGEQPVLYQESIQDDRRATYSRFAVRVVSRYAELIPLDAVDSLHRLGVYSLSSDTGLPSWKRLVVRPRWDRPLPRPNLRCLLPLSSSAGGDGYRCFLAVFNESWYQLAGFAERLGIRVASAPPLPGDASAPKVSLPEIGFDPILSAIPWAKRTAVSGDTGGKNSGELGFTTSGALGFTFETDSDAPLFNTTSFLLTTKGSQEKLAPWTFVKLQFRREIAGNASAIKEATPPLGAGGSAGAAGGDQVPAPDRKDEEWTQGHWVQTLPDAASFAIGETPGQEIAVADLSLSIAPAGDGTRLTLMNGTASAPLHATETSPDPGHTNDPAFVRFELWALVTAGVKTTGFESPKSRYAPEAYIATAPLIAGEAVISAPLSPDSPSYVRVVEVQRRLVVGEESPPASPACPELWEAVFPAEDGRGEAPEPCARIVRVSDPIGAGGPKWRPQQ